MIQEMARQNLSIETQLVKRNTKRNGIGRGKNKKFLLTSTFNIQKKIILFFNLITKRYAIKY
jgi:hypothetical protein